ncbi:hypothetical protein HZU77_002090 [Neisseriaceae bacterium TC5R-5]|nr:hypothetical protein [Neisseriaceae bacterium TC5R-5]
MQNRIAPKLDSQDGLFHDGNSSNGELGTIVSADWLNTVQNATGSLQDEVLTVLQDAGQSTDPKRKDQLSQAIKKLAWNNTVRPTTLAGYGITDAMKTSDWGGGKVIPSWMSVAVNRLRRSRRPGIV